MAEIPEEVLQQVKWSRDQNIPHERIRFFEKSKWSKGDAWATIPMPNAPSNYNPWRKCHSQNYWIWYCMTDVPVPTPKNPLPKECRARMEELHRRADRLSEMFINGNRNDVAQELLEMEPKAAFAVLTLLLNDESEDTRTSYARYFTEVA